jgi:hypothetical protein
LLTSLGVSTLPGELSRNFNLVRELDEQSQGALLSVEERRAEHSK